MIFLDTNTFISLLVNRDSQQTEKVKNLLKEAAGGKIKLITAPLVFFETKWVLRYFYDLDKETLINILRKFLAIPELQIEKRSILEDALNLYETNNIELEDCYYICYSKFYNIKQIFSFDKKFVSFYSKYGL